MDKQNIQKSILSFPVIFQKVEEVEDVDCRFTKVKIWLMHLGENFNGSNFKKSVVDDAIPTLGYIPIVGFIEKNKLGEKDFSDHRYIVTKNEDGICEEYAGVPFGVIKSFDENNAHYEERMCDDGQVRTFLVVDGLLWNMFKDSFDIMNRDLIKSHSMELWNDGDSIDGYEDENGIFHFTKFSFRAACILGKDYEPAMINSTIEVQFTINDFVKEIQSELNSKFTAFTKLINKKNDQGGKTMPNNDFSQTVMEQFSDISAIVEQHEVISDNWGGSVPRFYLVDIQDNEIIVVDRKDNYRYYGFAFTINGDKPEIDFANGNRKKICFENYEDGDTTQSDTTQAGFDFGSHIAQMEDIALSKVNEANEKAADFETNYSSIKADYDAIKPKYDELVNAEEMRISAELDAQKDAEFAKYETVLADSAEFTALKEKKADMTVEEIESECAILYARKSLTQTNFNRNSTKSVIVDVIDDNNDSDYSNARYGNIPMRNKQ